MSVELRLLAGVSFRGREVTSPRLRGLLAVLAEELKAGSGTARLVEALWPEERPENPGKALQILVSRARGQLGAELIVTTPTGYRLALTEEQVDAAAVLVRAGASARASRAGDHQNALAEAEAGLALWEGGEDAAADDPVAGLRAERKSAYRSLTRARALALARLGRHGEAIEELTALAAQRPRDEEILLELLRAEAATIGPAAALARFEDYRAGLRDELGADPGAALRALHRELLAGAAPAIRHGIPNEPNPLLGRDKDIAAVANLLRVSRVVSIVGPGGMGKTRLAYAVSREAEQRVVHAVPLAGVRADKDVAGEVASALGVGDVSRTPARIPVADLLAGIASELGPGSALLVLDNCEQVIAGVAELVHALVSLTKDVRVLTTSRAPLGISSESVYLLPELDLTTTVELFTQRATAARPDVDLPTETVAELGRRLEGLPLAVELAAARVRVMSVDEIARRLADRFALLRGGPRDAPERHHTLHAVVDWSWNLLDPPGQAAMRALSIFPGGFAADTSTRLVEDVDVLEHLVDQSLLKVIDTPAGTRFRMLETVREFSTARREEAGETDRVTAAFLAWARDFGVAYHDAPVGTDPYPAMRLIRAEQDNLLHALRLGLAAGDGGTVAATSAVLATMLVIESNFTRLGAQVEETAWLLSHYRPEPDLVEATRTALTLACAYAFLAFGPRATRSLVALRRLPHLSTVDTVVQAAAKVLVAAPPDLAALRELCDSEEPLTTGVASSIVSYLLEADGDLAGALTAAERVVEAVETRHLPWLEAAAHARVAELCLQLEQPEEVQRHVLAALPVYEEIGTTTEVYGLKWWMVLTNMQLGVADQAEEWLEQTEPHADDPVITQTYGLGVRAEILMARGEIDTGLLLWRRVIDILGHTDDELGLFTMVLEVQAVTLTAHARYGRVDLVAELAGSVADTVSEMLANPAEKPPPYLMEVPLAGGLLLALGMVDLDRGAYESGVRLIALADRLGFQRNFQPTMSSSSARTAAENADRSAYADAVSSYADLGRDELRAEALAVLAQRDGSRL